MQFYGGKKRVRLKSPRFGRCGCGRYVDFQPNNERVENRQYKVLIKQEKEYGQDDD